MRPLTLLRCLRPCGVAATRLAHDNRGLAAVEFAMIVPLMLVMFFGTVEFSSAVAVNRKVSMMAQTLSDLTSRYTNVGDTDISNFFTIGNAMLTPYSATPLQATITEIYIDPSTRRRARRMEQGQRGTVGRFDGHRAGKSDCEGLQQQSHRRSVPDLQLKSAISTRRLSVM